MATERATLLWVALFLSTEFLDFQYFLKKNKITKTENPKSGSSGETILEGGP